MHEILCLYCIQSSITLAGDGGSARLTYYLFWQENIFGPTVPRYPLFSLCLHLCCCFDIIYCPKELSTLCLPLETVPHLDRKGFKSESEYRDELSNKNMPLMLHERRKQYYYTVKTDVFSVCWPHIWLKVTAAQAMCMCFLALFLCNLIKNYI